MGLLTLTIASLSECHNLGRRSTQDCLLYSTPNFNRARWGPTFSNMENMTWIPLVTWSPWGWFRFCVRLEARATAIRLYFSMCICGVSVLVCNVSVASGFTIYTCFLCQPQRGICNRLIVGRVWNVTLLNFLIILNGVRRLSHGNYELYCFGHMQLWNRVGWYSSESACNSILTCVYLIFCHDFLCSDSGISIFA